MANAKAAKKMAKIIVAEKTDDGNYRFRQKIVPLDDVQDELEKARQN